MRAGSLPAALPLVPDPSTLSGFLDFCGTCFKIKNMSLIEPPGGRICSGANMSEVVSERMDAVIEEAIRRLVSAEHFRAGSFVSMPVTYPSGASVVIEVFQQGEKFFVSDRGGGFQEAEFAGASRFFGREARRVAEESGISFDGHDMFIVEVSAGRLAGAFTVIANCSQSAANAAVMRAAERTQRDAGDILFTRLARIFPAKLLAKDAAILGASGHEWHVSALVSTQEKRAAFEAVSHHYASIVSATAKFHDLARLELFPSRIAVAQKKEALGDYIGVISAASTSIIEFSASDETFLRLAA